MSALTQGAVLVETANSVQHRLGSASGGWAGWGDPFARAVLCNLLINPAKLLVWHVPVKDDPTRSPVMATAVVVVVPAFSGLDHSVADTVLFTMVGLREGIGLGLAAGNVAIALLGNIVGGGVLIGLAYAYVNDDRRYLTGGDA